MKKILIASTLALASTMTFANNVIVTETQNWKSVPITVNAEQKTYVVSGPLPEGDFYYSYSGYRCFTEKRDIVGVDAGILKASVEGGKDIYCYPE